MAEAREGAGHAGAWGVVLAVSMAVWPAEPAEARSSEIYPTVADVQQIVRGKDDFDTALRQYEAMEQLRWIITQRLNAIPASRRPPSEPPELLHRVERDYTVEMHRLSGAFPDRCTPKCSFRGRTAHFPELARTFYADEMVTDAMLGALMSPKWVADRYQREHGARAAAVPPGQAERAQRIDAERQRRAADRQIALWLLVGGGVFYAALAWSVGWVWRRLRRPKSTGRAGEDCVKTLEFGSKRVELTLRTGLVRSSQKGSETHVWSSGGTQNTPATVHSQVITKHEFWIEQPDGEELAVKLSGIDIPLRTGQHISLVGVRYRPRGDFFYYATLCNHNANAYWWLRRAKSLNDDLKIQRVGWNWFSGALLWSLVLFGLGYEAASDGQGALLAMVGGLAVLAVLAGLAMAWSTRKSFVATLESEIADLSQKLLAASPGAPV